MHLNIYIKNLKFKSNFGVKKMKLLFINDFRLMRNPIKIIKVRREQDNLLTKNFSPNTKKLIVFLTPGYDIANGGIISISSIYEETIKLKHIHEAEVIICTIPGDPLLLKYTKFNNQNCIYLSLIHISEPT